MYSETPSNSRGQNRTSQTGRRPWLIWWSAVLLVMAVHLGTARLSPRMWQDEVQILDWGRTLMTGSDPSIAMSWLPEGRSYRMISYLGCVQQEAAYRLAGGDPFGARAASILGAGLASFALLGWLLGRGTVPWIALGCSLLLICDPAFTQGYRGARVDSWSIAFMLLACWAASKSGPHRGTAARGESGIPADPSSWKEPPTKPMVPEGIGWHLLAGAFAAIAGTFWVSAILLLPLLVHEFGASGIRRGLIGLLVSGTGGGLAMALLFTPVLSLLPEMWSDFRERKSGDVSRLFDESSLHALWDSLAGNPLLLAVALASFLVMRRRLAIAAFLIAAAGALCTGAYIHRTVYLLPYLLLAVASAGTLLWNRAVRPPWLRPSLSGIVTLTLACSAAVSVAGRNFIAWQQRAERDPSTVLEAAEKTIGSGSHKVYLWTWDWYYAGRRLGWRYYKSFHPEDMSDPYLRSLLRDMDWLIVSRSDPTRPPDSALAELGFTKKAREVGNHSPSSARDRRGYGVYLIYEK